MSVSKHGGYGVLEATWGWFDAGFEYEKYVHPDGNAAYNRIEALPRSPQPGSATIAFLRRLFPQRSAGK